MAGHSKWANIQHRKSRVDERKGKIFTKLIREITVAARIGGSDSNANPRLRLAILKAVSLNMSKDTISRAIQRGSNQEEAEHLVFARYEGYGPKGTAFVVDCLTDNKNRTVSEVRCAFSKGSGQLGIDGCVAHGFVQKGCMTITNCGDETQMLEAVLDSGAEDFVHHETVSVVYTAPEHLESVAVQIQHRGFSIISREISFFPLNPIVVDADILNAVNQLIDRLEDLDDVQSVYTNVAQ